MGRFHFKDGQHYRLNIHRDDDDNKSESVTAVDAIGVKVRPTKGGLLTQIWTASVDRDSKTFLYTTALPENRKKGAATTRHYIGYNENDDIDAANTSVGNHNRVIFDGDKDEGFEFFLGEDGNPVFQTDVEGDKWLRVGTDSSELKFDVTVAIQPKQ